MDKQKRDLTEKVVESDSTKGLDLKIVSFGVLPATCIGVGLLACKMVELQNATVLEYFKYGAIGALVGTVWGLMNYFDSGL